MHFRVPVRAAGLVLTAIAAVLTAGHFVLGNGEWEGFRLFNLGEEGSFGTSYASILGLVAGALALGAAAAGRRNGHRYRALAVLGIGLVLYAVDEVAMVHEGLGSSVADTAGRGDDGMVGTALIGFALLPLFLVMAWAVLRAVPRRAGVLMATGLGVFWLGGFGVEQLEHMNYMRTLSWTSGMTMEAGDFLLMGIQEGMEMIALVLILTGALALLAIRRTVLSLEATENRGRLTDVEEPRRPTEVAPVDG